MTYTIVVTNAGPSNVTGATVADTFPATLTGVTYTAVQTGGASRLHGRRCGQHQRHRQHAPGSTITYTATATISAAATGNVVNTATVTPPAGVTDPTPATTPRPTPTR